MMKKATRATLSETLCAVTLPTDGPAIEPHDNIAPNVLYVRQHYHHLLKKIRRSSKAILMGNPGIGKSVFQYYYLLQIFNDLFGQLPEDMYGNNARPSVVIRHVKKSYHFYDVENGVVFNFKASSDVLSYLDPKKSLYMYEPMDRLMEPDFGDHRVPSLISVSPDPSRYKEFKKTGAITIYMPIWELADLLLVAQDMSSRHTERARCDKRSASFIELLHYEKVRQRFSEFGGIVRHCIPQNEDIVADARRDQSAELDKLQPSIARTLLRGGQLSDPKVSHLLAQYTVITEGDSAYMDAHLDVLKPIALRLRDHMQSIDLDDKIYALVKRDTVVSFKRNLLDFARIYEDVIARLLVLGVTWYLKKHRKDEWDETTLHLRATRREDGWRRLSAMSADVVYVPMETNFAFVDLLLKKSSGVDSELWCFHVKTSSKSTRSVTPSNLTNLYKKVALPENKTLKLFLVPSPRQAESASWKFEGFSTGQLDTSLVQAYVLKVPPDYYGHSVNSGNLDDMRD